MMNTLRKHEYEGDLADNNGNHKRQGLLTRNVNSYSGRSNNSRRVRKENELGVRIGNLHVYSAPMFAVLEDMKEAAQSNPNEVIAIFGESGTGKDLVARAIHQISDRREGPFVVFNCSNLSDDLFESRLFGSEKGSYTSADRKVKGLIEAANHGTLFLDEFGELSEKQQAKLLRLLQEGKYYRVGNPQEFSSNARIIVATNRNLSEMIKKGQFRKDLYYRLTFKINIPALNSRKDDIVPLANLFLNQASNASGYHFDSKVNLHLINTDYSGGNIRILQETVKQGLRIAKRQGTKTITANMLFCNLSQQKLFTRLSLDPTDQINQLFKRMSESATVPKYDDIKEEFMREMNLFIISHTLNVFDGNKLKAMRALGIPKSSFYKLLKDFNL